MSSLDRKLVRNILQMKGQVIAICLVIACGIGAYVMALSTMESLRGTMERYYVRYRFATVFANMKRAPLSLSERMSSIPGVAQVYPRVVKDVTLDIEGFPDPAIGRLMSVPDFSKPPLNNLHLRSGRWMEAGHGSEVLVSEAFADAHHLKPGDTILAILNGRKKELTIVGTAITPEYIFEIREGDILPDEKRFGLFWMAYTDLASAFDMDGAFNNVVISSTHTASMPDIIRHLDDLIEPYGGLGAYAREDQISHQYLNNELHQLESMARVVPSIFLSVAAFLLNVVLSRLISTQREEIAALKALGYTGWEIGWHYIKLMALIVTAGTILGTMVGAWMGNGLTNLYLAFYRFPVLEFRFDAWVIVSALAISLVAGVIGTFAAVRQAVKLPPAEAMRPAAPADFKPSIMERLGLDALFSQTARIIIRNLERRPLKAGLSVLGISTAIAVMVVGGYMKDSINYSIDIQFARSQRQDVTVGFVEPLTTAAVYEVEHLPGVRRSEPFRSVPARLRSEHHSRRLAIQGVQPGGELFVPMNIDGKRIPVPDDGLLVSRVLAEILHVQPGDYIEAEVLEGRRPHLRILVSGVIDDFTGLCAYMNIDRVHELMQEQGDVSGAYLLVDQDQVPTLFRQLKNTPRVAGVMIKKAAVESFEDTIAKNLMTIQMFNAIFGTIIAFGVVYNSARVSLSERSRELATLRVMGFTRAEISIILLGELGVLVSLAIIPGLFMGYGFVWWSSLSMVETELFRIPLYVAPETYGRAVLTVVIAAVISGLAVRRRLDQLNLIAVLKTRD
ncbi:MAG: FtsX-like permease family protein [Planctomycetaceae bacterium]|nr:FtsX-like permease family protein [Planctomycetaceae bacterium]